MTRRHCPDQRLPHSACEAFQLEAKGHPAPRNPVKNEHRTPSILISFINVASAPVDASPEGKGEGER